VRQNIEQNTHRHSELVSESPDINKVTLKQVQGDSVQVFSQECPLFVPLVEEGFLHHQATKQIAEEYLSGLIEESIDTLVLGCTHYPMLSQLLRDIIPNVVQIDSGEHSAVYALRLLAAQSLLCEANNDYIMKHNIQFYVTDYPNHFYELSKNLLGFGIDTPELVGL
ncbi:MAG: hypothetical protein FWC41_11430, partial [Firmicutes bacterium]|nr:hypothetical protein [Bacillota bacterium]